MSANGAPPNAEDAERALIGHILDLGGIPESVNGLAPSDFYRPVNEALWSAARSLSEQGKPVDLVAVRDHLHRQGSLDTRNGVPSSYLVELITAPQMIDPAYTAEIIREHSVRRMIIQLYERGLQQAHDLTSDLGEQLLRTEEALGRISVGQDHVTPSAPVREELRKLRVRADAHAILEAERRPPRQPFDAGTLREILARPQPPRARIDQLVPWQGGTLITAQRKVGKTTFMGNLCRALITGYDFLDRFEVRKLDGEIALLNFEMPADTLARWLNDMHVDLDRLYLINLRGRANPFANEEDRAELATRLRVRGTEAIMVDPFGRAYTGRSQNDPGEVGSWLADLDRWARGEVGANDLFLPAHAGWDGERTRGASALEDWADSIITLTRESGEDGHSARYIRAMGRDVDLEEDQLEYNEWQRRLTLAGTGSRKITAEKRKRDTLRPAILKILEEEPGLNGSKIEQVLRDDAVPFQRGEHRRVLKDLVNDGTLTWKKGPRNAKEYSLAGSDSPDSPDSPDDLLG